MKQHVLLILCLVGLSSATFLDDDRVVKAVEKFINKSKEYLIEGVDSNANTVEKFTEKYHTAKATGDPEEIEKFNEEFMDKFTKKLDMVTIGAHVCAKRYKENPCNAPITAGDREFDPRPRSDYEAWIEKVDKEIAK